VLAQVQVTAKVAKINQKTREVTLKTDDGGEATFVADAAVQNLARVKKGDVVTATYSDRPKIGRDLRRAQFLTAAGLAFSDGANDAQKSMGVLTLVLLLGGFIPTFEVPVWVMFACATAIVLGILSGGWRIVRTLGFAIYKVRPLHALNSQLTSAVVILGASVLGAPVSTTHVVATSIMGIGYAERPKAVRWSKAGEIASTRAITIPAGAMTAMLFFAVFQGVAKAFGTVV
jgi:inorganic phosphate transporter, PiT family